jgi:hypothetical protein
VVKYYNCFFFFLFFWPLDEDGKPVHLHASITTKVIVAIAMAEDAYDLILLTCTETLQEPHLLPQVIGRSNAPASCEVNSKILFK